MLLSSISLYKLKRGKLTHIKKACTLFCGPHYLIFGKPITQHALEFDILRTQGQGLPRGGMHALLVLEDKVLERWLLLGSALLSLVEPEVILLLSHKSCSLLIVRLAHQLKL